MAKTDVLGLSIAYDVIGEGARTAIITAGGRFPRDTAGVRALAEKLAAGGMKVLIWDRPNCGESDLSLLPESEWTMNADVLAGLVRKLGMAPAFLIGASAGARISIQAVQRHPQVARKLSILWLSGGPIVLSEMIKTYYGDAAFAARASGMDAVAELASWKLNVERNPANRERLLATDVDTFVATMERWANALAPGGGDSPVVGVSAEELRAMQLPTIIFNSSRLDVHHQRCMTERLAQLLPDARLVEPPWSETEWYARTAEPEGGLFASLPQLAPQLLAFEAA